MTAALMLNAWWIAQLSAKGPKNGKGVPHRVLFPGITKDAQTLGVHRVHLYETLVGKRTSHCLTRRYWELQKSKEVAS